MEQIWVEVLTTSLIYFRMYHQAHFETHAEVGIWIRCLKGKPKVWRNAFSISSDTLKRSRNISQIKINKSINTLTLLSWRINVINAQRTWVICSQWYSTLATLHRSLSNLIPNMINTDEEENVGKIVKSQQRLTIYA